MRLPDEVAEMLRPENLMAKKADMIRGMCPAGERCGIESKRSPFDHVECDVGGDGCWLAERLKEDG